MIVIVILIVTLIVIVWGNRNRNNNRNSKGIGVILIVRVIVIVWGNRHRKGHRNRGGGHGNRMGMRMVRAFVIAKAIVKHNPLKTNIRENPIFDQFRGIENDFGINRPIDQNFRKSKLASTFARSRVLNDRGRFGQFRNTDNSGNANRFRQWRPVLAKKPSWANAPIHKVCMCLLTLPIGKLVVTLCTIVTLCDVQMAGLLWHAQLMQLLKLLCVGSMCVLMQLALLRLLVMLC